MATENKLDTLEQELAVLRELYAQRLPARITELEQTWQNIVVQEYWNETTLKTFHRLAHSLAGSGVSYGFSVVGSAARTLELYLKKEILGKLLAPTDYAIHRVSINGLLLALKQTTLEPDQNNTPANSVKTSNTSEHWFLRDPASRSVFIMEHDANLAKDIAARINYFGYKASILDNLDSLKQACQTEFPSAIIMDLTFSNGKTTGLEFLNEFQQQRYSPIPIIFTSIFTDLMARLDAVRAGGSAYFTKPLDLNALVDQLDRLTIHDTPEPYRILIIEDDPSLAALYTVTLQQAGMITAAVSDPLEIMAPLVEFAPDLILMDVYMPGCSGLELAAVLRQQPAYLGIPIVFLSIETDIDRQQTALQLGGDDFLIKPIQLDLLVSSVTTRANRSRTLRSLMVRDSLTGLLNHTKLKEQLYLEVARYQRSFQPLSFVMLDIDHFKSVNDTYGHPVGDQVIKSLSRLLQQRLRRTDILGRYGGEEFAIILPDTAGAEALKVVDEIRERFSQICQQASTREFNTTFSAGIATMPPCNDAALLNEIADKALYQAKQAGRNRVILHEDCEI